MLDACGRTIDYVRISITDRCNLRCIYCMPQEGVTCLGHGDILTFEEIERVVRALQHLGVRYVRVTGGEPMARLGCLDLVDRIHHIPGIEEIAMTTNGILLDGQVSRAKQAGLNALNISLDTLDPDAYRRMARGGELDKVLRVINDALEAGLRVKINAVPVRGWNEAGLTELAAMARDRDICVRFIELMPVGCGAGLSPIPSDELEAQMAAAFGPLSRDESHHGYGPARYVRPAGFRGSIGFISPMSHEFCDRCNRVRLTADGFLKLCLNHRAGLDLRKLLREGISEAELEAALREAIAHKPKRHGFTEDIEDREIRRMNEIGG